MAAWEIDTFAYDGVSLDVLTPTTEDLGEDFVFSADGTKAYFVGRRDDTVYQFTLSSAWDLSTASYASISFAVGAQNGSPSGLAFPDGSHMYMLGGRGTAADRVYEYTVGTAWNVSTASYASRSLDVSGKDTDPRALFVKADGTKLWVAGYSSTAVHQYSMATPWDVSTATFDSSFSVSSEVARPADIFFKDDGTKLYVLDEGNPSGEAIHQYSLSSAWDISTATYDSLSLAVHTGAPGSVKFSSNGERFFLYEENADLVYQYSVVATGLGLVVGFMSLR